MAWIKINAEEVKKLRRYSDIRVTHKGNRVHYQMYKTRDGRKGLVSKSNIISLDINSQILDHDYLFEQKRRVRNLEPGKIFPITVFL